MKTDIAYEVVDMREVPIGRFGVIHPVPGGLKVFTERGYASFLEWDDEDDEAFIDDEERGTISVVTTTGRVEFIALGLDNWEELKPFWNGMVPDFETDEEVNRYFYERLKAS